MLSSLSSPISHNRPNPLPILLGSLLALVGGIVLLTRLFLPIRGDVPPALIMLMATISVLMAITSFVMYKSGSLQYLKSLRLLMLLMIVVIVSVMIFYLWLLSTVLFANSIYFSFMVIAMFFAGMSAISFGYYVSQAMTRRLFALADAAGKVAQGDFSTRLEIRGNDEIAYLAQSFNSMAADLQEIETQKQQLEQTRRDLVAWVSHDLRTPLTSMRVMLEALADGVITDEETQQRYVQTTLKEIQHLSHMITDLFEMAKLDVGHIDLDLHPTPIADLISDTMGSLMAKAQHKGLKLEGSVEDGIDLVYVAPDKIQRVLKNLIDNAIKYTPSGETVSISARHCDETSVRVDIHNTGVHIPPEILPNLFDSFYRGEKSRANTDDERGTGLGLAIARGFVQAHGGTIWAESTPELGTVFSFTIPNRESASS
ncbi:MAG: HAMP domain-containing sensor histidine kinase [Chloroflexota bacterium]